jgi:hypothetical protein
MKKYRFVIFSLSKSGNISEKISKAEREEKGLTGFVPENMR